MSLYNGHKLYYSHLIGVRLCIQLALINIRKLQDFRNNRSLIHVPTYYVIIRCIIHIIRYYPPKNY